MEPSDTIIKLMVTTDAGETKVLNIHRGLLCKSSAYFQSAMKPEWINLREQRDVIDLPDDSVETVSDYIRWLYSNVMPITLYKASEGTPEKKAEEAEKVFVLLAEAYVFGEKIMDAKYKNAVMKTVLAAKESSGWNMGPKSVDIIYKGTPSKSLLRRLIADSAAYHAHDDSEGGIGWMEFFDGYPREALVDAIKAIVRLRDRPRHTIYRLDSYLEAE